MAKLSTTDIYGSLTVSGNITGTLKGNADSSTQVKTVNDPTNATRYLTFVDGNNSSSANDTVYTHSGLKYNPSNGTLTTTTFSGALSGNASTATYATKIGTDASHPAIGSATKPVYVDSTGTIKEGTALGSMAYKETSDYLASATRGAKNGVASLDASGLVPSSQLPSYVDDVLEYSATSGEGGFPASGEKGKIYVDTSTNLTYRWSGSTYVEISKSLALGTTSGTAYAGDAGATLATNLSSHTGNTTVHITSDERTSWTGKYTKPSSGIPKTDLASAVQNSLGKADSALQDHQDISGKENTSNKVKAWSTTTTDDHYPSEKLVKDALDGKADEFSVSSSNSKASWGSSVTVGTVAGIDLKFTMPDNPSTSSDTSSKIYLVGATSQSSSGVTTYSDNQVYATNGQLDANKVRVAEKVTLQYNSTTESLDFIFG